jgi:hypothetical protein
MRGGESLQIQSLAPNLLNKALWSVDHVCSFSFMNSCNILFYRYKDGHIISAGNKNVTFHELREKNQTLISTRVTDMDDGNYTCKVSNGINEIQRKIRLKVIRKYL